MKKCSKCKQEKDYDGFYKDRKAKDEYNGICKLCRLGMDRERRKNDLVWVEKRKLQNKRHHEKNCSAIAERKKEWLATPKGAISHRLSSRKWKDKNVAKVWAHSAVERAIKKGIIIPKTHCEVCNSTKRVEAHHPDHRKKLFIFWLCKKCHEKV